MWFDHSELSEIWRIEMATAVTTRRAGGMVVADAALDTVLWAPDLLFYAAQGTGEVITEVATSVFEVIVSILEGL